MRPHSARPGQLIISGAFSSLEDPEAGGKAVAHLRNLESEGIQGASIKVHGREFMRIQHPGKFQYRVVS